MNKNQKILIVDDDQIVRVILSRALQREGFTNVLEATDGQEGIETARGHKPDLIVTDIMMPRMDGLHLIQEIHSDPSLAMIPIIVMTSREEMKELISMAEVQGFIPKPFDRETMLGAIKKVLSDMETAKELRDAAAGQEGGGETGGKAVDDAKSGKGGGKKPAGGAVSLHEKIKKILGEGGAGAR